MRAIKTTTVSILAVGLLAGMAVGVTAQDEEADPMGSAVLVWEYVDETDTGPVIEASDPRASGELAFSDTGGLLYSESGRGYNFGATNNDVTLTNDDGTWTGTYTQILGERFVAPQVDRSIEVLELSGEGGYEGLRLHLYVEGDGELSERSTVQWGFIYPSDTVAE